jgi:ribosomal protein L27
MEMPASRIDKIQVCTVNIATKRKDGETVEAREITYRQRLRWAHCTACRNADDVP